MESSHKTTNQVYQDTTDAFEQFAESTNPFTNKSFSTEPRPVPQASNGKRPRIYKPIYSARLS